MNAERLHAVARALREEVTKQGILSSFQNLVNACQQIGQNPANASQQQNYVNARTSFYVTVTDTPSDSFSPAWRQILSEMGGQGLFGRGLKEQVERIIAENQSTLFVAYQGLNELLTKLQAFQENLTHLTDALNHFHVGSEQLAPGEAEIAFLIPRRAVHDKLGEYASELKEMEFILNTFSEVATGSTDDLRIRTVSSTDLSVFLTAAPKFGAVVALAIAYIISNYKKILEIRKLSREIDRLGLPKGVSEGAAEYANSVMSQAIDSFTAELIAQYPGNVPGREHELKTKLRLSLNRMANRIDSGFHFEVRIEPPSAKGTESEEVKKAVQTIQEATPKMQYMNLEGQKILSLPEEKTLSGETADGTAATPSVKPLRRRIHPDDTKK